MGCGSSQPSIENEEINKQLRKDKEDKMSIIKLLLLGPGECGKSTILKQMQIIHNNGLTKEDLLPYRPVIYTNVLNTIQLICVGAQKLDINFSDPQLITFAAEFERRLGNFDIRVPFETDTFVNVKRLCKDSAVQRILERKNELQMGDSAEYFLENLERIQQLDYVPTQDDVLKVRAATSGIVQMNFLFQDMSFKVIDVGGQRSERRKWIHIFDDVTAIIFMAAISEYDQFMREDNSTNRMVDTLELFTSIINSRWFQKKHIVLFLNKIDLFKEKIGKIPFTIAFPQYKGIEDYDTCINFMKQEFRSRNQSEDRDIAVHPTCATDKTQAKKLIDNVINAMVEKYKEKLGMG